MKRFQNSKHLYKYVSGIFLIFLFSCHPEEKNISNDPYVFSGISMKDESGQDLSIDTNDWKLMEFWDKRERALFGDRGILPCDTAQFYWAISAYPNPASAVLNLWVSKPDSAKYSYRLVDQNLRVILSKDSVSEKNISLNLTGLNASDSILRMYYIFIGDNCQLNGHGDIEIR
jgi:hypothetical protein